MLNAIKEWSGNLMALAVFLPLLLLWFIIDLPMKIFRRKSRSGSAEVILLVVLGIPAAYLIGSALFMSVGMWLAQPDKSENVEVHVEEVYEQ